MKAKEKQKRLFEDKYSFANMNYQETSRLLKLNQRQGFVVPWQMEEEKVTTLEFL